MKKHLFILFLFWCASSFAYTRITTTSGETPQWSSMPISYWINEKGLAQLGNGSEFEAIQASFRAWENVPSANVRFIYRGTTQIGGVDHDGANVVSFTDTTAPLGSSTIAATFSFFRSEVGSDNVTRRVIDEADIVFNPSLEFSTSAEENKFDIQSVLTHEIGHLLGLDHSGMVSSVMVPFGVASQLDQRTLAYDDIAGITEIYPRTSALPPVGQIRGTIRSGLAGVFGAHVVAVDADGTGVVSTLSQSDGSYVLRFLPPGQYRVFAEPLDLPVTKDNLSGFYANARTDFGTTYSGNVASLTDANLVAVAADGISVADILTLPKGNTGLNLTRPGFAARIPRGRSGTLTVGGEDITAGVAFAPSSSGLVFGLPVFGGRISSVASTSARLDLSIASTTPLGPKNIAVTRGPDTSVVAGALVITDAAPTFAAVTPPEAPIDGGTLVTIFGANFRPGAQLYFGGLAATEVNVVNSGTLFARVPANSPGTVNVVVVNSDGTWAASSRAFTYAALAPVITRVTPLSGPPTTSVIIEGENFDSHLQNVGVQFNGISARVVSATPKAITTIVPFGVTTGPLTVSVFGRTVTGPVFNVTSSTTSSNLAIAAFNFIDASVGSGGAIVSFSNDDDAVAFATLPFNFSLFRDIYLAGSPISIATNGFLSLESLSVAEFQNGALPGQTVPRSTGGVGTIPPSLIAPFWDDLVMKSNSTVTTRTVGNAPNRQFVVQWSNLSILDDNGRDLNANLTFEAVLFEGSNDIQFLYRSVNGPRTDGSSATIGAQDLKRTQAVQKGFNQSVVSSSSLTTYHFMDGGYTDVVPDATPPSTPLVTDEGTLTADRTQLAASWISDDSESGIREFFYAIGATPGGTEVRPFTSTTQNSVVVTGLSLQPGVTYYFSVKSVNASNMASAVGVSDGIRYDPAFQPQIKIIPLALQNVSEFTGVALLAPTAMTVVLKAYDASGAMIVGPGIRNPSTVSLNAGQQYARQVSELLGIQNFDGWIQAEASAAGLGIFVATGARNMTTLDGAVVRETSSDFVLFHAGATAVFVNPSVRTATVTMTSLVTNAAESFSISAKGRLVRSLTGAVRVQSSELLAAVERSDKAGKTAMNAAVPITDGQSSIVFPQAVTGSGYASTLLLANPSTTVQSAEVVFAGSATSVVLQPMSSIRLSLSVANSSVPVVGAVHMIPVSSPTSSNQAVLLGVLDIENETGLVTIGARPAASEFVFPHMANGNGLFTGFAFTAGDAGATITIDVYGPNGGAPKTGVVTLTANQQLGRLVSELVAGVETQVGGYIRIRSDNAIWAWEIYGSGQVMASGPPL